MYRVPFAVFKGMQATAAAGDGDAKHRKMSERAALEKRERCFSRHRDKDAAQRERQTAEVEELSTIQTFRSSIIPIFTSSRPVEIYVDS